MRGPTTPEGLRRFMVEVGRAVTEPVDVYFTGGVTAILHGWRDSTIDIDLTMEPESNELLRAVSGLKESLSLNVELASPDQFIPALPGWRQRSTFITREGSVTFRHYDLYAQALSKIERGHDQDLRDVGRMLDDGLIDPAELMSHFEQIEPLLYRFPAIDPASFRRAVEQAILYQ